MVKLAYVVNHDWQTVASGVDTYINIVYEDWKAKYDCDLVPYQFPFHESPSEVDKAEALNQRIELGRFSVMLALGYLKMLLCDVRYAYSVRRRLKGRVIITNQFGCEPLPIALRIANPWSRIIAIGHTHPGQNKATEHGVRRFVEKCCYYAVSDIVFNSEAVKKEWCLKLGLKRIKGAVIYHGIGDPDLSLPEDYPEKKDGDVDFVCVSRFASWKGQAKLLSAWKEVLRKTEVGVRLVLVGDGETFEECRELAAELDVLDTVIFLGAKENGARYFNGADVAVQLSTEPEAFGLVLLEAMSRSKPVLASSIGGIPEVVEDGVTGFLVDPDLETEVVQAILKLSSNVELRRESGASGLELWRSSFKLQRMLRDYSNYFENTKE